LFPFRISFLRSRQHGGALKSFRTFDRSSSGSIFDRTRSFWKRRLPAEDKEDGPLINNEHIIPTLEFMALGIVLTFIGVYFSRFMQRRRERQQTSVRRTEETRGRKGTIFDSQ